MPLPSESLPAEFIIRASSNHRSTASLLARALVIYPPEILARNGNEASL